MKSITEFHARCAVYLSFLTDAMATTKRLKLLPMLQEWLQQKNVPTHRIERNTGWVIHGGFECTTKNESIA